MKAAGWSFTRARDAGHTPVALHSVYSATAAIAAGLTDNDVREAECSLEALKAAGWSFTRKRDAGHTRKDLG